MSSPSVYVTAYLEIGREKWTSFTRTFDEYLACFMPFLKLLKGSPDKMVVYIDKTVSKRIPPSENLQIVEIDKEWMNRLPIWTLLEREKEILRSADFQITIPDSRKHCPETWCAEYNMINHCKVDFVGLTIQDVQYKDFTWFSWVDFGFFKEKQNIPQSLINTTRLGKGINYQILNPPQHHAISYLFTNAPEYIGGFWFMGKRDDLREYQLDYLKTLKWFHTMGWADDDQTIAYLIWAAHPEKFSLWYAGPRQFHVCLKMLAKQA